MNIRIVGRLARAFQKTRGRLANAALGLALLCPSLANACACGCGLFDVGTSAMYANNAGGVVFLEYDFMDQDRNWSGTASAPAADNNDKRIRTSFVTAGAQYFFNRTWGVAIEVPYWKRYFQTSDESGAVSGFTHAALGDIRVKGTFTGFSSDMSTGLTLGLKLANGDSSYANFDPDTSIGTGSTDVLLGGYHLGHLSRDDTWTYFVQAQWHQPLAHKNNYRPGAEEVLVAGAYFEGWALRSGIQLAPVTQLRAVHRMRDGGADGLSADSGYTRILASPGIELNAGKISAYLDVALPLYTNVRGNQLVAQQLWKFNLSYRL